MTSLAAAVVVWLTGLPAAGKSSLAQALVHAMQARGLGVLWLDSDELRQILTPLADYRAHGRDAFYDVLGALAVRAAQGGVPVVVSATASRRLYREAVRARVPHFVEIWLRCAPAVCRDRDPKGLYRRADAGEIQSLPGVDVPYEQPEAAELVLDSDRMATADMVDATMRYLDAHRLLG